MRVSPRKHQRKLFIPACKLKLRARKQGVSCSASIPLAPSEEKDLLNTVQICTYWIIIDYIGIPYQKILPSSSSSSSASSSSALARHQHQHRHRHHRHPIFWMDGLGFLRYFSMVISPVVFGNCRISERTFPEITWGFHVFNPVNHCVFVTAYHHVIHRQELDKKGKGFPA